LLAGNLGADRSIHRGRPRLSLDDEDGDIMEESQEDRDAVYESLLRCDAVSSSRRIL